MFRRGMRHGRGIHRSLSGFVHRYTGEWAGDVRHGHGELLFVNGDSFVGQFVNGMVRTTQHYNHIPHV